MIPHENAPELESLLHKHFLTNQVNKVNPRKEFFRLPIQQIREKIETMGIEAKWTMTAEAREYKETLAIEASFAASKNREGEWIKSQVSAHDNEVIDE